MRNTLPDYLLSLGALVGVWKATSATTRSSMVTRLMGQDLNLACWGIIQSLRNRRVTEPKDRAYALYGILLALGARLARPDYTKSVKRIFRELFIDLLRWRPTALVLPLDTGMKYYSEEPGWVPQWDISPNLWIPQDLMFQATVGDASQWGSPSFEIKGQSLNVWAYSLGTIKHVFPVPRRRYSRGTSFNFDQEYLVETITWLRSILDTINLRKVFLSINTRSDLLGILTKRVAPFMNFGKDFIPAFEAWARILFNCTYGEWGICRWAAWHLAKSSDSWYCDQRIRTSEAGKFQGALQMQGGDRQAIFVTDAGDLCIGPHDTGLDDLLYHVSGIPLPFVLQPAHNTSRAFRIVGPTMLLTDPIDSWLGPSLKRIELV